MSTSQHSISLRVWHPTMRSGEISAKLNKAPRFAHDAGQAKQTPAGQPLSGAHKETYCSYIASKGGLTATPDCIAQILTDLRAAKNDLSNIIKTGGRVELFVGCYIEENTGFTLSAELLREVGDLGISISFDLYGGK